MTTFKTNVSTEEVDDWLGLGEASRILGVNVSTLRRWADAGRVRTFRTPGGHRRFSSQDLRRLTRADPGDLSRLDGEALTHIRERLDQPADQSPPWLATMPVDSRRALAELGRRTLALVGRSLDPDADRAALYAEAGDLGTAYACVLRATGLRLTDAVAAFAYFRRGMEEAVTAHARSHHLSADAAAGLWERVSALEDQLLVALTDAYEGEGPSPPTAGSRLRES